MRRILSPSNKDLLGIGFYAVLTFFSFFIFYFLSNGTYTVPVDYLITLLYYSSTTQRVASRPILYTVGYKATLSFTNRIQLT